MSNVQPQVPHSESDPYTQVIYLEALLRAAAHLTNDRPEDYDPVPALIDLAVERAEKLSRTLGDKGGP